ncbi:MAG: SDR family oxidoreductase [Sulfuriferula sp.]
MKFLVTGANGFVGRALCAELHRRGHAVRFAVRTVNAGFADFDQVEVGQIDGKTDWTTALAGIDVVMHLAARVHVMHETAVDPLAVFREVNVAGTERLARAAASSGVKRLVYVSSIKVNGEQTGGIPFVEGDVPAPQDPYGTSKYEAEQALHSVAKETSLEVVVVRPPLVYGPGVGGNFMRLLQLVARGVPLPLASVQNQRSMIYLGNFVDALITSAMHPAAVGMTYLVSDGEDMSTALLIRRMADLMGKRSWLWPLPPVLLTLVGEMTGKSNEIARLLDSLQIDSSKIRSELEWVPPYSVQQGLSETVKWFLNLPIPK